MTTYGIIGVGLAIVVAVLVLAFRPREKTIADADNGWKNPNFQKREKGESQTSSPAEISGYLGGGD